LSVDPALTAFAQLGALKLDCDRSFVSIIDHDRQYILAEATRTISLEEKDNHKAGDAIYLGRQALPIYWGVCPGTIQTFTDPDDRYALETRNVSANKTRYVIRNFMKEKGYQDRPYVAGWPFMRFYAEVPVHSPRGIVIGSYCVVDNKPRQQFGDASVKVLEEIARSVSHYLELTRMKLDYDRAVKLMTGLSSFVDNQRSGEDGRPKLRDRMESEQSKVVDLTAEHEKKKTLVSSNASNGAKDNVPALKREDSAFSTTSSITSDNTVAAKVKQTFQRASNLICQSMDLDGCTFNDAYTIDMHTRSNPNQPLKAQAYLELDVPGSSGEDDDYSATKQSKTHSNDSATASSRGSSESWGTIVGERTCEVLAYAEKGGESVPTKNPALPMILLQKLLKQYPAGHIFNSSKTELDGIMETRASTDLKRQNSSRRKQRAWRKRSKAISESALLFSLFPRACSIIFFPLYDSSKNKWCAACIGWSANPRRGLQDSELTYLAAFSNSIIAELGRLEAVAIGQAKTDFVGNISHELRSPLHGILASAELLRESSTGANQTELISMVESCGKTLLDTMNHLLDHAKINNFAKENGSRTSLAPGVNGHGNISLVSDLDLQALVEEVVEAMFTGYAYQKRMAPDALISNSSHDDIDLAHSSVKEKQDIVVYIDIDTSARWVYSTEAGAWRRLIMNVFGNSLKYTTRGSIRVSMHAEEMQAASGTTMVHLSVSDTGKGISKDYLKHKLYSPFSQEDNLAVGAGLGLSIVQQIVHALSGTIEIESELSVGTTVMISIPLTPPLQPHDQNEAHAMQHLPTPLPLDGVTVCLLDLEKQPEHDDASRKALLNSSMKKYLQDFRGLTVRSATYENIVSADVYIAEEEEFTKIVKAESRLEQKQKKFKDARLILLRTDTSQSRPDEEGVIRVCQPFGPSKLKKALLACLGRSSLDVPGALDQANGTELAIREATTAAKLQNNATATPSKSDAASPQPNGILPTNPHPHVLLVDDNDINRKIMCTFMRKLKCTYATACDGLQALEAYKRESAKPDRLGKCAFDWILMDLSMPIMDGLTATREIRAFEEAGRLHRAKVVALTGLASTNSRDAAEKSGVDVYLTKPVQLRVIRGLLGLD
jgi:signal transduction histidine kinase/CheY-like chemotaxis protein